MARIAAFAVLTVFAAFVAGCGQSSAPRAPKAAVDDAISGLAEACGQALEATAFGDSPTALARLDATASVYASRLAGIYRSDPKATYLGESMKRVLDTEIADARSCRLEHAAKRMLAARDRP